MEMYSISAGQKRVLATTKDALSSYAFFTTQLDFTVDQLTHAWEKLVESHDILRTRIEYKDDLKFPFQVVGEDNETIVKTIDNKDSEAEVKAVFDENKTRIVLVLITNETSVTSFALSSPAYLLDSYSLQLLAYQLTSNTEVDDPLQYNQYVEWQKSLEDDGTSISVELKKEWEPKEIRNALSLRNGFDKRSYRYKKYELNIDADTWESLKTISNGLSTDVHHVLWMIWNSVLSNYINNEEWASTYISQGRDFDEFKQIPGVFARDISVNCKSGEQIDVIKDKFEQIETYREYYSAEQSIQAGKYSIASFDFISTQLLPEAYQHQNITCVNFFNTTHPFEIQFSILEIGHGLRAQLQYDESLYHKDAIEAIAELLQLSIGHVLSSRETEISNGYLLSSDRIEQLSILSTGKITHYGFGSISDLLIDIKDQYPEAIAIQDNASTTYRELMLEAGKVANALQVTYGIKHGDKLVLNLDRSKEFVITLLGAMMLGATYVPVDNSNPERRIKYIYENSEAALLVTNQASAYEQLQSVPVAELMQAAANMQPIENPYVWKAEDVVYIIYTSGTTGSPKGCVISMRNLQHYICWANDYYFSNSNKGSFPLFTSIAFDLTVTSIFSTLTRGATLHIYNDESTDLSLERIFSNDEIDAIKLTPSHIRILPHLGLKETRISTCIVGGEELYKSDIEILRKLNPDMSIYNEYGPTECTVGCIVWSVDKEADKILIGRPIDNTQAFVLNKKKELCLPGVEGELYIGGKTVGAGYINNNELTDQKFIESHLAEGKLYETGDMAYMLPDGHIVYQGRNDSMVKVNGYRVELEAINNTLKELDEVQEVHTIKRETGDGTSELISYYKPARPIDDKKPIEYLKEQLPSYMMPAHIIAVPEFKLTTNGKLDISKLPLPEDVINDQSAYEPPATEMEQMLVVIWQQVLHREQIGVNDHFMSIGGDSIKAIQITGKLRDAGWKVTVKDVMEYPTVKEMAERLTPTEQKREVRDVQDSYLVPLTPLQRKFLTDNKYELAHYNQSILLHAKSKIDSERLEKCINALWKRHAMLRTVFINDDDGWKQQVLPANTFRDYFNVVSNTENIEQELWLTEQTSIWQKKFDLEKGPLFRCVLFRSGEEDAILIVAHHLIVDGVSWRVLMEDISYLYSDNEKELSSVEASYLDWSEELHQMSGQLEESEGVYWKGVESKLNKKEEFNDKYNEQLYKNYNYKNIKLSSDKTQQLIDVDFNKWGSTLQEVLLLGLSKAVNLWRGDMTVPVYLESHGRNSTGKAEQYSSTIGWFTSKYPFVLSYDSTKSAAEQLTWLKTSLQKIQHEGIGYFVGKYLVEDKSVKYPEPEFSFNYLGHIEAPIDSDFTIHPLSEVQKNIGDNIYMAARMLFTIVVASGQLQIGVTYHKALYDEDSILSLQKLYLDNIRSVIKDLETEKNDKQNNEVIGVDGLDSEDLEEIINSL